MSSETVLNLANMVQKTGAGEAHMTMNNVKNTQGLTAVISVYDNVKPSHMVLDELYDHAEHNDKPLKEIIEKLSQDMTWNEENERTDENE